MDELVAGVWLGEWLLEEQLGAGGFARVWRARHATSGQQAALKVPADLRGVELLRRAGLAPALAHPGIVPILERHLDHDPPFLVLELVPGGSLRKQLQGGRPLPPARALAIVVELAAALDLAHEHGRLHLDVKPENVLLDADGRARLTDFGGALPSGPEVRHSLLASGELGAPGTRDYAAPELREGSGPLDRRADVYSLGVLAFELLTGRLPLGLDRPAQLQPGIPAAVDGVLERALRRDPSARTLSAGSLARELASAFQEQAAVHAHPPTAPRRRRRPLPAAAALLVGLALVLTAVAAPSHPGARDQVLAQRLEAVVPAAGSRLLLPPLVDLAGDPLSPGLDAAVEQELVRRGLRPHRLGEPLSPALFERAARNELTRASGCELALDLVAASPADPEVRWAFLLQVSSWTVLRAAPARDPAARELAGQLVRVLPPGELRALAVLPARASPGGAADAVTAAFDADLLAALVNRAPGGLALRARAGALRRLRDLGPDPALALSVGLVIETTLDPARGEAVARLVETSTSAVLATAQTAWSPPADWVPGEGAARFTPDRATLDRLERHVRAELERAEEKAAAHLWRGEARLAIELLEGLRSRGPAYAEAPGPLLLLGRAHEEAGELEPALACYEEARRIAPGCAAAREALAHAVREEARRRYQRGKGAWWRDDDEREFQSALLLLRRADGLELPAEDRAELEALRRRLEDEL